DRLVRDPHLLQAAALCGGLDAAAIMDVVGEFGARELPGIPEGEPILGEFHLPAVADDLAEEAVVVTDAVAARRDAEARHALHQAGGEPPQSAIAERGVRLGAAHAVEIDAEIAERRLDDLGHAEVLDDVGEQPPDQEFEREVIDALAAAGVTGAVDREPAMDNAVAQG